MKFLIAILTIASIYITAFASVDIEDTSPMYQCLRKSEKALSHAGAALGMGAGVGHMGGMEVLSKRQYKNGKVVYALGGGPLASKNSEGYISGSGAVTLVALTKNSCDILDLQVTTGRSFFKNIDLGEDYTTVEP